MTQRSSGPRGPKGPGGPRGPKGPNKGSNGGPKGPHASKDAKRPSGDRRRRPGGAAPGGKPPRKDAGKVRTAHHRAGGDKRGHGTDGPDWLYGTHAVRAALLNPRRRLLRLLATPASAETIAEPARRRGLQVETVDGREIDRLFPMGTVHQGLALRVAPLPDTVLADVLGVPANFENEGESDIERPIVILDQVTDPQNVGAVLRSAAVFGARAVVVPRRNSPAVTGSVAKAASGAVEQMPLVQVPNISQAIAVLQNEGWFVIGLDGQAEVTLAQVDLTGKIAIVMGAEGTGLRRLTAERCDRLAKIPGEPGFASLNVSNATAVALYEVQRQRG